MSSLLVCRKAIPDDFAALQELLEFHQYELSDIWHQDLDAKGRYGYDLSRHGQGIRFHAHVALYDTQYAGFALVAPAAVTRTEGYWMEQFFIMKRYRRCGAGASLARHVFASHPGLWEVGQMPTNAQARKFWRRIIAEITDGRFTELQGTQGWWQGTVQQFNFGTDA